MEEEIKDNYISNFKVMEYSKMMNDNLRKQRRIYEFYLTFLYEVFSSSRCKGRKLLEIGSGPTVYNIASAATYFSDIVLSDFVPDNCEELKLWLRGQSSADWSKYFDLIDEIEGRNEDKQRAREELISRIRRSVKCVVECDILSNLKTQLENLNPNDIRPPYDAVLVLYCLKAACLDFESYVDSLRRINEILIPGGTLLFVDYANVAMWHMDGKQFHHLNLSLEDVLKAVQMANFRLLDLKAYSEFNKSIADYDTQYCILCEKVSNV